MSGIFIVLVVFVAVMFFLRIERHPVNKDKVDNDRNFYIPLQGKKFQAVSYKSLAISFVDMGLALIGCKTPETQNILLTSESEKSRELVEKNFIEALYLTYQDVNIREMLMKHFMLFKESMLIYIFTSLLKDESFEGSFCELILSELVSRLSEGLNFIETQEQDVYRLIFLKYLDDSFMQTYEMQQAVLASFWNTAIQKYPDYFSQRDSLHLVINYFLCNIFLYTYDVIEGTLSNIGIQK